METIAAITSPRIRPNLSYPLQDGGKTLEKVYHDRSEVNVAPLEESRGRV